MSSEKTDNLSLNQWALDDLFQMEEFNADNQTIDQEIHRRPLVQLASTTLTGSSSRLSAQFDDGALSDYAALYLYIRVNHTGTGTRSAHLILNGQKAADYYCSTDLTTGEAVSTTDGISAGMIAGTGSGPSVLNAVFHLSDQGMLIQCKGLTEDGTGAIAATNYGGTPAADHPVTRQTLTSIQVRLESSSARFQPGSTITVYGLLD